MKKFVILSLTLALAACGKPAERPGTPKLGELAPQVTVQKITKGDLKEMKGWEDFKGKAVVLEFWGPGCAPCVENIPRLNGLAEKFKDKPVVFLSLAREREAEVLEFLKTHDMKGNVAAEAGAAFKTFRVFGIPHTVLIDKSGRVAAFSYPSRVTEAVLEDLLAGKKLKGDDEPAQEDTAREDSGALALFSAGAAGDKPKMKYSDSDFEVDGMELSSILETALRDTHGVEYVDVPESLKSRKLKITARVAHVHGLEDGPRLRELFISGINGALPLKVSVTRKNKKVYLLKKNGTLKPALALSTVKGGGRQSNHGAGGASLNARAGDMEMLAGELEEWIGAPVLDETGLDGRYDFKLEVKDLTPKAVNAALTETLGLKLVEGRREIEITEVKGAASEAEGV
ncbi:MAG: hypothetical protein A2X35_09980 [Elusimicrobia bacterium GWA2_61_42]|nr:MAG: hypothetical protein A2X35_09980 [Elusimicrobia bacterium GWA2_61_42]OGR74880.1 MAG: hypothetical protein A2X38_08895 [Elusimicrobia bacterium GWC2_61_25]